MIDLALTIRGEELILLPERAVHWPAAATVFVADLHVGKAASLRASGAPVPGGSTSADLDRLSGVIRRTGASRVIVLGDWHHARAGRVAARTRAAVARWRERHAALDLVLVRGNHDVWSGDPDDALAVAVVAEGAVVPPFVLRHHPAGGDDRSAPAGAFGLAGHVHPGVSLRGGAGARHRLACFWLTPGELVLPAFGSTTGTHAVRPGPDDRVFAIVEDEVVEV